MRAGLGTIHIQLFSRQVFLLLLTPYSGGGGTKKNTKKNKKKKKTKKTDDKIYTCKISRKRFRPS